MSRPRATSLRRAATLSMCLIFGLSAIACQDKPDPYEVGFGVPDTGTSREAPPKMAQRCPLEEVVTDPAERSPEWVVKELLAASSSEGDEQAAFQRFYGLFDGQQESWVRQQYWPRARQHVSKYLAEGDGVVYTICRREGQTDTHVKLFIRSNDEEKSNPPITLKKNADGEWKVTAYTP